MSPRRQNIILAVTFLALCSWQCGAQEDRGWRILPESINIQAGDDRPLQLLDDSAQELSGAKWSVDDPALADIREENGRAVVHAKAPGTVKVSAALRGEKRVREIRIWPSGQPIPLGTTTWGMHPIGRELGDISAVPTLDGPHTFSLEQTAGGDTYLRGVREDGIQVWAWLMPEKTRDVELVCGDWMGGALISANRGESYTLYTIGSDGKLRWQYTLAGVRKGHAISLEHTVNVLSQSANGSDGFSTRVTGLDEATGARKFELDVPASRDRFVNVRRAGTKILCEAAPSTSPVETMASRLFVNIDGFAYVAFTQNERTLETAACTPGSGIEPRNVNVARQERVVLWQVHPDGKYRSTIVEESKGNHPLSEPAATTFPTGGIIPDGLGGVLLSIRRSPGASGEDVPRSPDEFVYRLDRDGKVVYRFSLPKNDGPLFDEMVLGQNEQGFATRGGLLIVFSVLEGKELWRWDSRTSGIKVYAALANGSCLVQTPAALVEVQDATSSREILKGQAMLDWQGQLLQTIDPNAKPLLHASHVHAFTHFF